MQFVVGDIIEGKITGLTKFGAFVELSEGNTGMVHISEIASVFVEKISDFVKEGQLVKVKVLNISENGKISLSMKKAEENKEKKIDNRFNNRKLSNRSIRPKQNIWQGTFKDNTETLNFEDMMSKFKKSSDEKISDLKKTTESKRGGFSRRGSGQGR